MSEMEKRYGCVVCAEADEQHCLGYVSIAIDEGDDVYTRRTLCCWEHAQVWVAANEPPFGREPDHPQTFLDRLVGVGCVLIALFFVVALFVGIADGADQIYDWVVG